MFHYFTLEEVYEYAKGFGFSREEVDIVDFGGGSYEVSFGWDCYEAWYWTFDDGLEAPSTDYQHLVWED